ncbi:MAG TPA: TOBE domain-containing protein, partial [Nocardioidaceae bacterium]|nr:TOBE domain-containing protein [Nocardioidaceae bacterium]
PNSLTGTVDQLVYVGATTQVQVRLPQGQSLQALVVNDGERDELVRGTRVTVTLPPDALRLLAPEPAA